MDVKSNTNNTWNKNITKSVVTLLLSKVDENINWMLKKTTQIGSNLSQ